MESKDNFRALAENANDGILIAIGGGEHVYANRRASEITGFSIQEILEIRMQDLAHPNELKKLKRILRKRLEGKPVPLCYETAILRKDGKKVPVDVTGAKTYWEGQPADIVIIRDITDRKHNEEELEALANKRVADEERKLQDANRQLVETNTALSTLASNIEIMRKDTEATIERKIRVSILPIIEGLEQSKDLTQNDQRELRLLQDLVAGLTSTFNDQQELCTPLSPTEFRIAALIKEGLKTNEIARHMHISPETVKSHRQNIRKKLNIDNTPHRLRAHLQAALDR